MKSLLLAYVVLVLSSTAQAGTVKFSGDVSKCSMHRLVSEVQNLSLQGDRNITVLIGDSDGGDLYAAIKANQELRRHNVNTHLHGTCSSSCTVLFAVGRLRSAKFGQFMFHAAKVGTHLISATTATAISIDPCQRSAVKIVYGERLTEEQQTAFRNKFAGDWVSEIRQASPLLADDLERKRALSEGDDEVWVSVKTARKNGFVNN